MQTNQIGFRLGFIALLFIVVAAYFSQGCALVATDQVPDPSAVIDPPLTCYADSSPQCGFVYSCNEPSPNPGLEGRCAPMPDAKGIRREVAGKADIWCCDPIAPQAEPVHSCDILGQSTDGKTQLFVFNDTDAANPDPANCEAQGGGAFLCQQAACLVLPYTGTCPHCGGGGE